MAQLANLIPDPTTAGLWQCRPAGQLVVDYRVTGGPFSSAFSSAFQHGLTTPVGNISVYKVLGNFVYGMISSGLNPGNDEPFCYSLTLAAPVPVSGITGANTPVSPLPTGPWTPPTMALVGAKLMVTHPGFTGAAGNFVGWFDLANPAAPVWHAGNLSGAVVFTVVPSAVSQFGGRAYYIHNAVAQPAVIYSDVLDAIVATNARQVLTFGDNVALTALGGLPLSSQLGGIIQALMVFKGVTNIYQITGDDALGTLSVNSLNVTTGTLAPNTICPTPKGLAFIAPDGLRVISFTAQVSDPIGISGAGVSVPFINAVVPSRMAAACNGSVFRASVQNGAKAGAPNEEYWYDIARAVWHGPHSFPAALIQPYAGTFLLCPLASPSTLFRSDPVQSSTSTFTENGTALSFIFQTPALPDTEQMVENAMTETTLDAALGAVSPLTIVAQDADSKVLDTVTIASAGTATVWGAFTWGVAVWSGLRSGLKPRQINWHLPIVFSKLQLQVTGLAEQNLKIGTLRLRYQMLRYLQTSNAA